MEGEFESSSFEFVVALCGLSVGESLGTPIWRCGTAERGVAESKRELGRCRESRGNVGVMGGSRSLEGSEESAATERKDMKTGVK